MKDITRKKIWKSLLVSFLLALFWLAGCAGNTEAPEGTDDFAETAEPAWKVKEFVPPSRELPEELLWVEEFIPWEAQEKWSNAGTDETGGESGGQGAPSDDVAMTWQVGSAVHDGMLYLLCSVSQKEGEQYAWDHWEIRTWNTLSGERDSHSFTYEDLGLDPSASGTLRGLSVTGENDIALWWEDNEYKDVRGVGYYEVTGERILYLRDWNPEGQVNLGETLAEKGILASALNCAVDGRGDIFVWYGGTPKETNVFAFDQSGGELAHWRGEESLTFESILSAEDGTLVFALWDNAERSYQFLCLKEEEKEMRMLGKIPGDGSKWSFLGMVGELIFYQKEQSIYAWNVTEGTSVKRLDLRANSISDKYQKEICPRHEGDFSLWLRTNDGENYLAKLSSEKKERNAVQVVDLVRDREGSKFLSECVSDYAGSHLNSPMSYQTINTSEGRDRLMAELFSGEGPDLFYVSREDMVILSERGLLLDLRELISKATLDALLPGAVQLGQVGDSLKGIPGCVRATGIFVPDAVWKGDSWTLEDVIRLMDQNALDATVYYAAADIGFAPLGVTNLLTTDWKHSFLYDAEKNACHFEDERFIRLLEMLKAEARPQAEEEWFGGGRRMVYADLGSTMSMREFGIASEREGGHSVGYPTDGASGNFLNADGCLAVNCKSRHLEEIREFLELFLSEEEQKKCQATSLSVRKFPLDQIVPDENGRYWFQVAGMREPEELYIFEDGTTPIHRAEAFLESCVAYPITDDVVYKIIYEEVDAYFSGDKSARDACNVIQSRVQLYLDE